MRPTTKQSEVIKKVIATYNEIGEAFDATRRTMWPEFLALKQLLVSKCNEKRSVKNAGNLRLLDAGCGNGRIAHYLSDIPLNYYGFDGSKKLIQQAQKWWSEEKKGALNAHFATGNILNKKYTKPFDAIVSSAVLHHLPSRTLQSDYLKRTHAMLAAGGFLYVSVWNLWQPKYTHFINPQTHESSIPWGKTGQTRFYYAFLHSELITILTQAGFSELEEIESKHNFCFIAWKK